VTSAGGSAVAGTVSVGSGTRCYIYGRRVRWTRHELHCVVGGGVLDLAGHAVAAFTSSFTTGRRGADTPGRRWWRDAARLDFDGLQHAGGDQFSEAINPVTVTNILVRISRTATQHRRARGASAERRPNVHAGMPVSGIRRSGMDAEPWCGTCGNTTARMW